MNNNIPNNDNSKNNVTPYRASSNLNTAISNPTINIYDPMNINIQNSITPPINDTNGVPESKASSISPPINNTDKIKQEPHINNQRKEYTTINNKKSLQKKLFVNIGSEFKIALLIVVILLVFIFILPTINGLLKAH